MLHWECFSKKKNCNLQEVYTHYTDIHTIHIALERKSLEKIKHREKTSKILTYAYAIFSNDEQLKVHET